MLKNLHRVIEQLGVHQALAITSPAGEGVFLVGGAIRNNLLGLPFDDLDFAMPFDPTPLARQLAKTLRGHWFMLDEQRRQARVLCTWQGEPLTLDFAPFRGPTLDDDLKRRDFTFNSLALPVWPRSNSDTIIDPCGGLQDLQKRQLRVWDRSVLEEDPVRLLKGVRHAVQLDLRLDPTSAEWMQQLASSLASAPGERLRTELASILGHSRVADGFRLLYELQMLPSLFGLQPDFEHYSQRALQARQQLDDLGQELPATLQPLFDSDLEEGLSCRNMFLLSLVLGHRLQQTQIEEMTDRLKLSRRSARVLAMACSWQSPGQEELRSADRPRSRALWVQENIPEPVEGMLWLLLQAKEDDRTWLMQALQDYLDHCMGVRIPDLLDGTQVMRITGTIRGPQLGRLLKQLRFEEISGRIETVDDAEEFLFSKTEKIIDRSQ